MSRLPLRLRLTVLMTVLFGVALAVAAGVVLDRIEESLRSDTRDSAEALLVDYLDQVLGGSIAPASPAPEAATQFLYLDDQGDDLTAIEYQRVLYDALAAELESFPIPHFDGTGFPHIGPAGESAVLIDASMIEVVFQPVTTQGDPVLLDRGADVIAVGVPVLVGDTALTIAVSSPLQPVTASIDTLGKLLLLFVPVLTVVIAVATWIIVGRSLRPVDAITAQVDRISTESLHQRVPESESGDELAHLARTMNRMLSRLEQARDSQRQFISDASHELRSPITATQATLEVALQHPETVNWRVTAAVLRQENTRLACLVDDLLVLARLDETDSEAPGQEVDLDELCLAEAQRPHPRTVHVHIADPARVTGDLGHLTRAVRNVVDNATHHAATRVDVSVFMKDDVALIEVSDDGPGLPAEDTERIFERFSRLESSRSREGGGGAGLGLAITKQIVTAHHGTITADNRPNGGARFTIALPRTAPISA